MKNKVKARNRKNFLLFLGLYSRIKIQKRLAEIMLRERHNENKNE